MLRTTMTRLATFFGTIVQWAAIPIHIATVFVAYHDSGAVAATLSFFVPIGSELYWGILLWHRYGFANLYTLTLFVLLVFAAVAIFTHNRNPVLKATS